MQTTRYMCSSTIAAVTTPSLLPECNQQPSVLQYTLLLLLVLLSWSR
jgi:hypothetical protein